MKPLRFFLDQYGCAKNQVDGELIIQRLRDDGWQLCDSAADADLIIINSCGFIEAAKKESLTAVLTAKKAYPHAKILLAGCLAERYGADLHDNLSEADGIFGNGDISLAAQAALATVEEKHPIIIAPQNGVCAGVRENLLSFAGSAYVKITEGCNNHCSFCAIPLIRGNLRSRTIESIISEITTLLQKGIFEINLIGQDLASFGADFSFSKEEPSNAAQTNSAAIQQQSQLSRLLSAISALDGNFWVRLLYIHPDNFPLDILPLIQADSRILPYFDIPFQSGSDTIIAAMNRKNTAEKYVALVQKIRATLPNSALRTTFLAGFPGETDEDFSKTRSFLQIIKPDWSGCFTYSREDGTPADALKKHVPKKTAAERKKILEEVQSHITAKNMQFHVGRTVDVLIEEHVPGFALGRAWFQAPEVDGAIVVCCPENTAQPDCGTVVQVRITDCTGADLKAVPV